MFKRRRFCLYMMILFLIVIITSFYRNFATDSIPPPIPSKIAEIRPKIHEIVTHVIRMPYVHQDSLKNLKLWPNTVIVSNEFVKTVSNNSLKILHTDVDLMDNLQSKTILDQIRTPFIILSADFPKKITIFDIKRVLKSMKRYKEELLIIPFDKESLHCLSLKLALREWTIKFERIVSDICSAVDGKFMIMTRIQTLKKIQDPWMLPFPDALFLQAFSRKLNTRILKNVKFELERFGDRSRALEFRYSMYEKLKIKKVVWDDRIEWYGCSRNTTRCFGTVFNDTPDYLYQGRWTPPCCLRVLRETAR